jgi:hypothetical protein
MIPLRKQHAAHERVGRLLQLFQSIIDAFFLCADGAFGDALARTGIPLRGLELRDPLELTPAVDRDDVFAAPLFVIVVRMIVSPFDAHDAPGLSKEPATLSRESQALYPRSPVTHLIVHQPESV